MSEEISAVMPEWYDGKKINEVMFCDAFLEEYPTKCIRGQFFTVDGLVDDENMIRILHALKHRFPDDQSLPWDHG